MDALAQDVTTGAAERRRPVVTIEASGKLPRFGLAELWAHRELVLFLAWRDLAIRYKQAFFGVAWAVLQPVLLMVVFTVVLGNLGKLPSQGVPYALLTFVALIPWLLFSNSLQRSGLSVVANANLVTKVYFPRLAMPVAGLLSALVDCAITFVILFVLMGIYGVAPTLKMLLVIPFTLLTCIVAAGFGLWFSAINVRYRDVQYVIPFLLQAWQFISPVGYSAKIVPGGAWSVVYALNPLTGVIAGFRWAVLGTPAPALSLFLSSGVSVVVLVTGLWYFRHSERHFADII